MYPLVVIVIVPHAPVASDGAALARESTLPGARRYWKRIVRISGRGAIACGRRNAPVYRKITGLKPQPLR
jgi:hypothetical protein